MHVYETTHPVAHSADEMFALVARVEDYPKFLPLCEALTVKHREQRDGKEVLIATMTVGYGMIHESFTTGVHLDRAARTILVEYLDGPFTFLENRWHFQADTARGLARSTSISPTAFARACSSGWWEGCSPRRSRDTRARSRPVPTWFIDGMRRCSLHNNERSSESARSTLRRLISARPRSPNRTHSLRIGSSRRPAAK